MEEKLKEKIKQKEISYSDERIRHIIIGETETISGRVPILSTEIFPFDKHWELLMRLGIKRDDYTVPVGVYAIGNPDIKSPVMVTGNYKLTIDKLRGNLIGIDTWLLVIDTKGVNVWCAAGKGTFSTEEVIFRIKKHKIGSLVDHKTVILPQLSAPGVSAWQVTKYTGFKVEFGPVHSGDIIKYFENGNTASDDMRRVRFGFISRMEVALVEAFSAIRYLIPVFILFVFVRLIQGNMSILGVFGSSIKSTFAYLIAILIGTFVFPAVLPKLPFRMFSAKAGILGLIWSFFLVAFPGLFGFSRDMLTATSNILLSTSVISYLGLNYTGSTTFTSLSGVKKETMRALPVIGSAFILGLALIIVSGFIVRI